MSVIFPHNGYNPEAAHLAYIAKPNPIVFASAFILFQEVRSVETREYYPLVSYDVNRQLTLNLVYLSAPSFVAVAVLIVVFCSVNKLTQLQCDINDQQRWKLFNALLHNAKALFTVCMYNGIVRLRLTRLYSPSVPSCVRACMGALF